jgi:UDP-N-acetylmuramate dehydrogenase
VLINAIRGYELTEQSDSVELVVGAGEPWDEVVARSVAAGLSGIEALSLIPGTAGATPVQNVGAYGQDISQSLVSVEAYDIPAGKFVEIPAADCAFSYRASRFNQTDRGRFCITAIHLRLHRRPPQPPFYAAVTQYLGQHNVTIPTPAIIREAVIAIRSAKLPDPAVVANCGSFFGNPIISAAAAADLLARFPDLPQLPGQLLQFQHRCRL